MASAKIADKLMTSADGPCRGISFLMFAVSTVVFDLRRERVMSKTLTKKSMKQKNFLKKLISAKSK